MFGMLPFDKNEIWNPLYELEREFFKNFGNTKICRTDIIEEENKFILECEMPGVEKSDIKIDVNNDILTLCASHKNTNNIENEYICKERNFNSYCRSFSISGIDENAIDATYTNGILKLSLPKKEKQPAQTKRIEIK